MYNSIYLDVFNQVISTINFEFEIGLESQKLEYFRDFLNALQPATSKGNILHNLSSL